MGGKRTIRAKDIVNDIRARMTDSEIMSKYSLSAKGLDSIFQKLVEARAVKKEELFSRIVGCVDTVNLENERCFLRSYPAFPLPIYETDNVHVEGTIRDISERGIQVSGIEAQVNETKEFLVRADEFQDIYPFVIKAQCRWVHRDGNQAEYVAGFEITEITEEALRQLRTILRTLSFCDILPPSAPLSDEASAMAVRSLRA